MLSSEYLLRSCYLLCLKCNYCMCRYLFLSLMAADVILASVQFDDSYFDTKRELEVGAAAASVEC